MAAAAFLVAYSLVTLPVAHARDVVMAQDGTDCTLAAFAARTARVNAACCPPHSSCAASASTSLPPQCSADCAVSFYPFYHSCKATINTLYTGSVRTATQERSVALELELFEATCARTDTAEPWVNYFARKSLKLETLH